jgi:hypothetical protein
MRSGEGRVFISPALGFNARFLAWILMAADCQKSYDKSYDKNYDKS